jgi:hypothetical protein
MRPFLVALGHLLWRSLTGLVGGWMATSILALVVGLITHFMAPRIDAMIHGEKSVKKSRITGSVIVTLTTWLLLFAFSMTSTVYTDHVRLVSENHSLVGQNSSKDQALKQNADTIRDLSNKLSALTSQEPNDSLRRRTFKLADEFTAFLVKSQKDKPPDAFPSSADPNPSEERKKAMRESQAYYRAIEDFYFMHFKDRFVGIVKEYNAKGVRTGYLEYDFAQRVPYIPAHGSVTDGTDDLSMLRDLAYHVDGRDHLITF